MLEAALVEPDIRRHLEAITALFEDLLGSDLFDRDAVADRVSDRAIEYANQLTDPDTAVAHQAALALRALVDVDNPTEAATPLGVAVARTESYEGQLISQTEAARLLRVSRQRVNDLIRDKRLEAVDRTVKTKRGTRKTRVVTRSSVAIELKSRLKKPLHLVERIDQSGCGLGIYLTDTGQWATAATARTFPTLREASRVAATGPNGVFARGVDVHPFGGQE